MGWILLYRTRGWEFVWAFWPAVTARKPLVVAQGSDYTYSMRTPLALLVLLASPIFSAEAADPVWRQEPDSDWAVEVPAVPDGSERPTVPEGGFANPDEQVFRDRIGKGMFDRICRRARLTLQPDFDVSDLGGVGGSFGRRLRQLPNGHEALIDSIGVRLRAGHEFAIPIVNNVDLRLWAGATAEAESTVMRPLAGTRSCEELDTLLDLRDVKTVFPFRADRIAAMQVGELWRLPIRLQWGYRPGLSGGTGRFAVTVSAGGYNEGGQAALTLYRLSADQLRMRFRIEDVEIRSGAGSVVATIPAVDFGSLGASILARLVDNLIAGEMSRYIDVELGRIKQRVQGRRILLELILNPNDPAQMQALSQVVRGDLRRLMELVARREGVLREDADARENARELESHYGGALGADVSTVIDTYSADPTRWTLNVPFITRQGVTSSRGDDRFERLDSGEGEIRIYHAERGREQAYGDLPFIGALVRDNTSRSAQVVTQVGGGGASPPAVVYIRQHGFENITASDARRSAGSLSSITALIGRESAAGPGRTQLPVDALFPAVEARRPVAGGPRATPAPAEPAYDKGAMTLAVLVTPEGLAQALAAEPTAIVRAYANLLDESDRAVLRAIADTGFDPANVQSQARIAAEAAGDTVNPAVYVRLAERAARFVADIATLRAATDNDQRAAIFAGLVGGDNESGLEYDRFMSVLVQLVDPTNVRADFSVRVDRDQRGVPDLSSRYRLNGGIDAPGPDGPSLINRADRVRRPFRGIDEIRD